MHAVIPSAPAQLAPHVRANLERTVARALGLGLSAAGTIDLMETLADRSGISPDDPARVRLVAATKELSGWRPCLRLVGEN